MGLKTKKEMFKKLEFENHMYEFLEGYGIDKKDLMYLPEALKIVKDLKINKPVLAPEKTQKEKDKEQNQTLTPAEFVSQFSGEEQEFYPYGREKTNN